MLPELRDTAGEHGGLCACAARGEDFKQQPSVGDLFPAGDAASSGRWADGCSPACAALPVTLSAAVAAGLFPGSPPRARN